MTKPHLKYEGGHVALWMPMPDGRLMLWGVMEVEDGTYIDAMRFLCMRYARDIAIRMTHAAVAIDNAMNAHRGTLQ